MHAFKYDATFLLFLLFIFFLILVCLVFFCCTSFVIKSDQHHCAAGVSSSGLSPSLDFKTNAVVQVDF